MSNIPASSMISAILQERRTRHTPLGMLSDQYLSLTRSLGQATYLVYTGEAGLVSSDCDNCVHSRVISM